jgi:thiol-disulfide isomerase/thioredoxin
MKRLSSMRVTGCFIALACSFSGFSNGADSQKADPVEFPSASALWINSPPLTKEMIKDKCVALWFFEEQCPSCREKWLDTLDVAASFEGKPVVFVAVNSGTDRATVEQYAKGVGISWPVLVDPKREFESQWKELWGGEEISLAHVCEIAVITRDGRRVRGRWDDEVGTVRRALAGREVPKEVPGAFVPTWKQIQARQYAAALPMLKKGLASPNADVKAAAQYAEDIVESNMSYTVTYAKKENKAGRPWEAYKSLQKMTRAYEGYKLPEAAKSLMTELAKEEQVRKQMAAQKALDTIKKTLPTIKTATQKKRTAERLKEIVSSQSGTEAAQEAEKILAGIGAP